MKCSAFTGKLKRRVMQTQGVGAILLGREGCLIRDQALLMKISVILMFQLLEQIIVRFYKDQKRRHRLS